MAVIKECNICINKNKNIITCKYCEFEACKNCVSKYILESINDAKCMNCHKYYDREYLLDICGKNWYNNSYKPSRENVMFEREKILFNESIPFAEMYKNGKKIATQIEEIEKKIELYDEQIKKYNKKKSELVKNIHELNVIKQSFDRQIKNGNLIINTAKTEKSAKQKFYVKCSYTNCDGTINDKDHVCIKCEKKACKKCFEPYLEEHKCDENIIATIEMMKKDTKPCPKCTIPIHRTSGCYQMWCTSCHTTFHYNTGEILKETIHNPHYIEWLSNNAIKQNNNNCNMYNRIARVKTYHDIGYHDERSVLNIYRMVQHINNVLLPDANANIDKFADHNINNEIRVKYLVGDVTEEIYKRKLFMNYKQLSRWTDIRNYLQLAYDGMNSICVEFVEKPDIKLFKNKLNNLIKFLDEESRRLVKLYENTIVHFEVIDDNTTSLKIIDKVVYSFKHYYKDCDSNLHNHQN